MGITAHRRKGRTRLRPSALGGAGRPLTMLTLAVLGNGVGLVRQEPLS